MTVVRPIATIRVTSDFEKSFRKLPRSLRDRAEQRDRWFRANAFDPRLRTHSLKGALDGYWAYSVTYHHRALFRFLSEDEVLYYDIGTHEIYR